MNAESLSPFLPVSVQVLLFFAVFGAVIGSFLTLVTYRMPLDEVIGRTRSRCTKCGATLRARDLIPVVSWLLHRGRCRHCSEKVSPRYILTELACAVGGAAVISRYGVTLEAIALLGLWWCMVAVVVTDLEHYIILDEVQIATGLFGILYAYATHHALPDVLLTGVVGASSGLLLKYGFLYLRHKDALGMGDVKFLFVAGIWLHSPQSFVPFLFISGVLGTACGLLWRALGLGDRFPFGPALALALLVCVAMPQAATDFWQLYGLLR